MKKDPDLLRNGAEFHFDPPVVSYWSQWLGHPAPSVSVVGQDCSNVDYFQANSGRDDPQNKTNANLHLLLAHAGIRTASPPSTDRAAPVFLTNSILCLKVGSMSEQIKDHWVRNCSMNHLVHLIAELAPSIVVGMGKHGWNGTRQALHLSGTPTGIKQAAGSWWKTGTMTVFAVGHCSGLGLVNRPMHQQISDWQEIGRVYATLAAKGSSLTHGAT